MAEGNGRPSVWTVLAVATPIAVIVGLDVWYLADYGARLNTMDVAVARLQTTVDDNFRHPDGVFDKSVSGLAEEVATMKRSTDATDQQLQALITALGKEHSK